MTARSGGRSTAFRIIAGIFGFVTVAAILPFEITSFTKAADSIHRMHNTAALVVGGVVFIALSELSEREGTTVAPAPVGAAA